ncbi:hypothetical protein UFOVP1196_27 [uncultured Caudovirales phage]|uniref:DUF7168 domain-containing protein n=1 Tax=uncultured Caudovirales phage TaxID=2100421 RepID=A0A6J5R8L4_9CAUD|nr:hypothetical protein UFOVP1196_27 [uncultured Caudovirales phage]
MGAGMNALALPLHADDVLLFTEIRTAMEMVARKYTLPLRSIEPLPSPEYSHSPLGDCSHDGNIRLVLRGMKDGIWDVDARREQDVWDTAAHELAHLKHFNHGVAFHEFEEEMRAALGNRQRDHRDRIMKKLVKLQASREGEAQLGNSAAAEAFAGMINKMLVENELNPSDLDYARSTDNDPVIEIPVNFGRYNHVEKKVRIAWEESLARVVAHAHLCTFLIRTGSNHITMVGTKSHATVAEYVYGTLAPLASKLADEEYYAFYAQLQRERKDTREVRGFRPAWLDAFIERISERFQESRAQAVAAAPEGTSQALMRLDGALQKTRKYIDDKFNKKRKYANPLNGGAKRHAEGRAWGRAAADRMILGRKGVNPSSNQGRLD